MIVSNIPWNIFIRGAIVFKIKKSIIPQLFTFIQIVRINTKLLFTYDITNQAVINVYLDSEKVTYFWKWFAIIYQIVIIPSL